MSNLFFSGKIKMADVIKANHNLILTLSRLSIPFGFGEKSVEEVCKANGIPVDFFILICNVYTFDDFQPTNDVIENTNLEYLIPYLLESHKYYMVDRLPHIEHHLHTIANNIDEKYGNILKKFYADYKQEVRNHFDLEEHVVFPYLINLKNNKIEENYSINNYKNNHGDLEEQLTDLTQIVYKYLPSNVLSYDITELVFDILQFSSDLYKHTLIEEKILIPYIEIWERRNK